MFEGQTLETKHPRYWKNGTTSMESLSACRRMRDGGSASASGRTATSLVFFKLMVNPIQQYLECRDSSRVVRPLQESEISTMSLAYCTSDTDTSEVSFILFSTRSVSQKIGQAQTCAQVIVVDEKSHHSVKIKVEQYSQHTVLLDTKLNVSTILNQSSIYGRGLAYIYQTSLPGTFLNRRHYHDVYLGMPLAQNGYMAYLMYQRALAKLVKLQQTGIQDHGQAYFKVQSATMLPNATWSLREGKASQSLLPHFHLFISFLFLPRNFCALIALDTRYRSQSYTRTQGGIQTSKISALVASRLVQHSGEREVCFPNAAILLRDCVYTRLVS